MGKAKLKPCPFCGEKENIHIIHNHYLSENKKSVDGFKIECGKCGGGTRECYSFKVVSHKWNKRK